METLRERYDRLVSEGALTRDAAQEAVLPEFERIRAALC
jgi:cell division protein ZapE